MTPRNNLCKFILLLLPIILSACSLAPQRIEGERGLSETIVDSPTKSPTNPSSAINTALPITPTKITQTPRVEMATSGPEPTQQPTVLNAENWKQWPVMPPFISDEMHQVYKIGLANGNNDHAFSILGDCHSLPDIFMGIYEHDLDAAIQIDPALRETVIHFKGSFDRYSPTVADGATEGALLWAGWNGNKEGYCEPYELPIDCELRYHKPIIAFVHIGTHWENRNEYYLRAIIEKLLDNATVPIIVTKADNRELDERVNENLTKLSLEYKLPVWNFWASVQHLPNNGVDEKVPMNLTDKAYQIHREDGLRVLDYIYRELSSSLD